MNKDDKPAPNENVICNASVTKSKIVDKINKMYEHIVRNKFMAKRRKPNGKHLFRNKV